MEVYLNVSLICDIMKNVNSNIGLSSYKYDQSNALHSMELTLYGALDSFHVRCIICQHIRLIDAGWLRVQSTVTAYDFRY
jgi:hypothetical protein